MLSLCDVLDAGALDGEVLSSGLDGFYLDPRPWVPRFAEPVGGQAVQQQAWEALPEPESE